MKESGLGNIQKSAKAISAPKANEASIHQTAKQLVMMNRNTNPVQLVRGLMAYMMEEMKTSAVIQKRNIVPINLVGGRVNYDNLFKPDMIEVRFFNPIRTVDFANSFPVKSFWAGKP